VHFTQFFTFSCIDKEEKKNKGGKSELSMAELAHPGSSSRLDTSARIFLNLFHDLNMPVFVHLKICLSNSVLRRCSLFSSIPRFVYPTFLRRCSHFSGFILGCLCERPRVSQKKKERHERENKLVILVFGFNFFFWQKREPKFYLRTSGAVTQTIDLVFR
jgi:hypothetical protein